MTIALWEDCEIHENACKIMHIVLPYRIIAQRVFTPHSLTTAASAKIYCGKRRNVINEPRFASQKTKKNSENPLDEMLPFILLVNFMKQKHILTLN